MYKITDSKDEDLEGILVLQRQNLKDNLTAKEIATQGFVTLEHNMTLLSQMNTPYPHTIAVNQSQIVGYALSMMPELHNSLPALRPMFNEVKALSSYVVMGQVCIHKDFRKIGIFRSIYEHMKNKFRGEVDYIVTEVANDNIRSMHAHFAVGFKKYCEREGWSIILLEIGK